MTHCNPAAAFPCAQLNAPGFLLVSSSYRSRHTVGAAVGSEIAGRRRVEHRRLRRDAARRADDLHVSLPPRAMLIFDLEPIDVM